MPFTYMITAQATYGEATADTAKLDVGSDWTRANAAALLINFHGKTDNGLQNMYVRLKDAAAAEATVVNPLAHAPQADSWQQWSIPLSQFSDAGVNLASVTSVTIGLGDKTGASVNGAAGQIFLDGIILVPAECTNDAGLDLRGDVNGDCVINFLDVAILTAGWLNEGTISP